jgi:predicted lipid-binding transport protein (Tim44 family)
LLIGFFTIFSGVRFRSIWIGMAAIGLLVGILFQASVMFLALQSAAIGMALTLLGLVIERLLERSRSPSPQISVRDTGLIANQQNVDSTLNRSPAVGSDDSTAIRVRAPSSTTMDFVPTAIAVPQPNKEETRGSSLERARSSGHAG